MYPNILPLLIALTIVCPWIAPTAQSNCSKWHLSNKFTFIRSDGRKLTVGLLRHGDVITGEAYYYEKRLYHGYVKGDIQRDDFNVMITWQSRREIYKGRIDAQGHLSGTTYDEVDRDHRAAWYTKERLRCAHQ